MTIAKAKVEEPHYKGHRDRLRQRFIHGGADALADYELLELLLFMAIPRKDVKPLAKDLIKIFGSYKNVLNASHEKLAAFNGLSETSAITLKSVQAAAQRLMKQEIINMPVLNSWARLIDYCTATMAHEKREFFRILFLNKKNELIADEVQGQGTVDHTPVYVREVARRSLELGATALILVHNHPSGDATPSQEDIEMTREIVDALEPLSVIVHDHLIISKNGHTSFRSQGLI